MLQAFREVVRELWRSGECWESAKICFSSSGQIERMWLCTPTQWLKSVRGLLLARTALSKGDGTPMLAKEKGDSMWIGIV